MDNNRRNLIIFFRTVIFFQSALVISCGDKIADGVVLVTETYVDSSKSPEQEAYNVQSWIAAINIDKPAKPAKVLTADFYAARSPEVSYDGKNLLFCAKKNQGDPWQVWEMNLKTRERKQVTHEKENCSDPAYLPGKRCVFSKRPEDLVTGKEKALFVCNLDGSEMQQISFHPHADINSTVMLDGRIVTASKQMYPEPSQAMLMVMRPDGTKAEKFYMGPEGTEPGSRAWERQDGMVFFTEYTSDSSYTGNVIAVNQNRPLHSRMNLTLATAGSFRYVFPLLSGRCLVSYRPSAKENYALYLLDPKTGNVGMIVFGHPEYHIIEAVAIVLRQPPRDLPSEVNEPMKTGIYFCQDIGFTGPSSENSNGKKSCMVRLTGINQSMGKVKAEKDGSFHLQVIANTPFRIQTLNDSGDVVNGPSAWLWIRPNERRGCIGCHQDPELAPENRLTLSSRKPPVLIPSEESFDDEEHIVE
jgi:hypothetical protein